MTVRISSGCTVRKHPAVSHCTDSSPTDVFSKYQKHLLPKSRMVKFLFFISSFGDLKENCCPAVGRSWSLALNIWITCRKRKNKNNKEFLFLLYYLTDIYFIIILNFKVFLSRGPVRLYGAHCIVVTRLHTDSRRIFTAGRFCSDVKFFSLIGNKPPIQVQPFWQKMWNYSTPNKKCQPVLYWLHVRHETRQWIVLSVVLDTVAEHLTDNLLKFLDHLNTQCDGWSSFKTAGACSRVVESNTLVLQYITSFYPTTNWLDLHVRMCLLNNTEPTDH